MRRGVLFIAAGAGALMAGGAQAQQAGTWGTNEVSEVIVEAGPLQRPGEEIATPVIQLAGDELVHRRRATLGDTLSGLPGVNSDTFGAGASRPVIRGQAAPRVKVLSDSSELMDASAVSPDHAVTTEPLLLREIEVLTGPSALLYGGGAVSGAVNLIDEKVPTAIPQRGFEGVAELRAGTNAAERAGVFGLTAGAGNFALRIEGVERESDDYAVPGWSEDRVHGTFNDTSTLSAGAAWVGEAGYLGAAYTRQKSRYGLPGHNHEYETCHPHGTTLHCGGHGHDDDDDHDHDHDHEEGEDIPFVDLTSERFDIRGEYRAPIVGIDRIRLRAGITDYRHAEIDEGVAGTTFYNKGHDARLEMTHKPLAGWRGVVGFQTAQSDFRAIGGMEAFLPKTDTTTTGLFLFEELDMEAWRLEFAVRQDWQEIDAVARPSTDHSPFSASAAAVWKFAPDYSAAVSLSRSQRAPTAQELYARGLHLATNTYEIGDPKLDVETANTLDVTLRKTGGATTFTVGVFHHRIDDYIFADTLDQDEDFRLIRYEQRDARFTGVDGELRHRFSDTLSAAVFGDVVRAEFTGGGGDAPRIPAARLGGHLDARWNGLTAELEYYRAFEQDRIADYEQATPGYDMLNATVAYTLDLDPREIQIYARGTNLLDDLALNHASFISRAAPLPGRAVVFGVRTVF